LPNLNVTFVAEEAGVDSLSRQIKMTGRAFPLFEIAQMVLQKSGRYSVQIETERKKDSDQVAQKLFHCVLDDTLWLTEESAIRHVLEKHFDTFYKTEKIATDPPKGTYTFVAQCGISGELLGPPNHHDYQNNLRRLHKERFARMDFESYKSRVRIVREEEVVKKWVEEQSFKIEFTTLNEAEEHTIATREEVEKHFRETHASNIVQSVDKSTLKGDAALKTACQALGRLVRVRLDEQRRFPLKVVHVLSQQFAQRGLQFFKVEKNVTYVSVARPHYLDLDAVSMSDGIKKIVGYVKDHEKCNRKQLVDALAPDTAPAEPAPEPSAETPAEAPVEGEAGGDAKTETPKHPQPTAAQQAVITDLHWLIHQGHIIEFANGKLLAAKKPVQQKPKKKPAPKAQVKKGDDSKPKAAASEKVAGKEHESAKAEPAEAPAAEAEVKPSAEAPAPAAEAPAAETEAKPAEEAPAPAVEAPAAEAEVKPAEAAPSEAPVAEEDAKPAEAAPAPAATPEPAAEAPAEEEKPKTDAPS
jgi:hypothetical protein